VSTLESPTGRSLHLGNWLHYKHDPWEEEGDSQTLNSRLFFFTKDQTVIPFVKFLSSPNPATPKERDLPDQGKQEEKDGKYLQYHQEGRKEPQKKNKKRRRRRMYYGGID